MVKTGKKHENVWREYKSNGDGREVNITREDRLCNLESCVSQLVERVVDMETEVMDFYKRTDYVINACKNARFVEDNKSNSNTIKEQCLKNKRAVIGIRRGYNG